MKKTYLKKTNRVHSSNKQTTNDIDLFNNLQPSSPGLKRSSDRMRDRASRDLCPPDSSVNVSFHTEPNATLTSKPAITLSPSGGCSLADVPGSRVEKMLPKSRFTFTHVVYGCTHRKTNTGNEMERERISWCMGVGG